MSPQHKLSANENASSGPFRTFKLVLNGGETHPLGGVIFRGGELLSGRLEVTLKRPMVLHAVRLQVKGRACWQSANQQADTHDIGNRQHEKVYFDSDLVLLERPPGRPPGDFPWAANYTYTLPFECPIPGGCPTSYEGARAFVRYFCRCLLEESVADGGTTVTYSCKKAFTMLAAPPDAVDAGLSLPVAVSETAVTPGVCGCCCNGRLAAEIILSKTCFVPGEVVYAKVKVDTKRESIDGIECHLLDRAACSDSEIPAVAPSCLLPNPITETDNNGTDTLSNDPDLSPGSRRSFYEGQFTETMRKRSGPPPFSVEYELRVVCAPSLTLTIPITVGALPVSIQPLSQAGGPTRPYAGLSGFVLGPQDITEGDDADMIQLQPLVYTPFYPVRESDMTALNGRPSTT